jgi:DNA-directed RNA polymerase subunit RPC12/RpoP
MTNEEAIKEIKDASDSEVRYGDKDNHYDKVMKRVEAFEMAIKALKQQPKVGKWIRRPDRASDIEYRCSECGKIQFADDTNELNYCCNCGSKMEVEE